MPTAGNVALTDAGSGVRAGIRAGCAAGGAGGAKEAPRTTATDEGVRVPIGDAKVIDTAGGSDGVRGAAGASIGGTDGDDRGRGVLPSGATEDERIGEAITSWAGGMEGARGAMGA